jgi:hypothetical protein
MIIKANHFMYFFQIFTKALIKDYLMAEKKTYDHLLLTEKLLCFSAERFHCKRGGFS